MIQTQNIHNIQFKKTCVYGTNSNLIVYSMEIISFKELKVLKWAFTMLLKLFFSYIFITNENKFDVLTILFK